MCTRLPVGGPNCCVPAGTGELFLGSLPLHFTAVIPFFFFFSPRLLSQQALPRVAGGSCGRFAPPVAGPPEVEVCGERVGEVGVKGRLAGGGMSSLIKDHSSLRQEW